MCTPRHSRCYVDSRGLSVESGCQRPGGKSMRNHLCTVIAIVGAALVGSVAKADHGFLGIGVAPGQDGKGVMVHQVMPDSPATKAGLKNGDRIMKVGDQEASDIDAFMKAMDSHKPGDKLTMTVQRDGKEEKVTATLGERPNQLTQRPDDQRRIGAHSPVFLGITMAPITEGLRQQTKLDDK